ncbi:hypothetical protein LDENG_00068550 [Lucifuga dentata]|nr:hypothetical protein LDENG_00068550 [Lucifuga dentata]
MEVWKSFSGFYRQQYSAAYIAHLQQEVEPKKEGRSLLLKHRPCYAPEEVLYQGSAVVSFWDEQGRKSRERYVVLRRGYTVEIHESTETFSRGCTAKLVIQPAGGAVLTTEEESRAQLEQSCSGILNGVKEDSSLVASSPDVFSVYLHLPYTGHTCFLFPQEEERDRFLSAVKTCIRHRNLDPWRHASFESQAFVRAFQLHQQSQGRYESWEKLLGGDEQVLACQVMEEVLPWLQSQLQSRAKGKRTERMRQWMAMVQAAYTLVMDQLTEGLDALKGACRETMSANQTIRSNLDQITTSCLFLEDKIRACICSEANETCRKSITPYLSSILEMLTENIRAGIQEIQRTLHAQMDAASGEKALSSLTCVRLDRCYRLVENLTEKLEGLKHRFGFSSTERLVQAADIEMEQVSGSASSTERLVQAADIEMEQVSGSAAIPASALLDSAVYTLELFLQSSAKLQPSEVPVRMERAKERVLKQLEHDSRVVQRRLCEEALLEITLPALTRSLDNAWKTELQQFEQYIFSDYSSFILVHNIYADVLRDVLSQEIEKVLQDAANKQSSSLLSDGSDLAMSQYSLVGQMPPRSAPSSSAIHIRDSCSAPPGENKEPMPLMGDGGQSNMADFSTQSDPNPKSASRNAHSSDAIILSTQQPDESTAEPLSIFEEPSEEVQLGNNSPLATDSTTGDCSSAMPTSDAAVMPDLPDVPESSKLLPLSPEPAFAPQPITPSMVFPSEYVEGDQSALPEISAEADLPALENISKNASPLQASSPPPSPPAGTESPMKTSLASLSEAIGCSSAAPSIRLTTVQQVTDRAVYLRGGRKDSWEVERVKEGAKEREKQLEGKGGERNERPKEEERETGGKRDEDKEEERCRREMESIAGGSESPAGDARTSAETSEHPERGSKLEAEKRKDDNEEEEEGDHPEMDKKKDKGVLQSSQPIASQPENAAVPPLGSVDIIRGLVTEVIEVETTVLPFPNNSHTA